MAKRKTKYYYDKKAAQHAVDFIQKLCTHVKGKEAGMPLILEKWQRTIIEKLFGWKRPDGTRQYRKLWLEIPRKNGKTSLCAAIGLYMLFGDDEPGAEVYFAAASKDQAKIGFEIAVQMTQQNKVLNKYAEVFKNSIVKKDSGSSFKALSAEAYTKHGLNASCILLDEIHAQPNRELYDVLTTSMGSRRQPLTICITTAGIHKKGNFGWEMHREMKEVADGVVKDDSTLSIIYAASSKDDPFAEATWKKCNPNYGVSLLKSNMEEYANEARTKSTYYNTFLRLQLNVWTSTEQQFIPPKVWDKCNLHPLNLEFFHGKKCTMAFDLSSISDFTALSITTKDEKEIYHTLPFFFIPEEKIHHRNMRAQIEAWVREGYVIAIPGKVVDYHFVYNKVNEISKLCTVTEISYDKWNANMLSTQLTNEGANMFVFRQGYVTMSPATKQFETLVIEKKINHGGNPVLAWMNSNMAVTQDAAGNIKPDKSKSSEKIDGMITTLMSISRLIEAPAAEGPSVYETRGLLTI